jgi:PleD family two-component response regulator
MTKVSQRPSSASSEALPPGTCPIVTLGESIDIPYQALKILAVDDSAISRKLVDHSLSGPRYCVLFAKDGREALGLFAEHLPAVVITDWEMPDI